MLSVNQSEALAELTAAFAAYEKALLNDDVETLNALFWNSSLTVRYGTRVGELQYSHQEIAEFRIRRGPIHTSRLLRNTRITTFGRDFGVANTEYMLNDSDKIGRQSQTWMRTTQGWRIISAHVSFGQ